MRSDLLHGHNIEVMNGFDANSLDACVTDPPYELTARKKGGSGVASINLDSPYGRARIGTGNGAGGFMGMKWDGTGIAFDPGFWTEVFRVMKPGAHLLAFGGTRTYHRMVCAIEDAGFEIRDQAQWLYGNGFPKSLDVSKAIDRMNGSEREITGSRVTRKEVSPTLVPNNDSSVGLNKIKQAKNHHPTVKPIALMQHLCRLITPPGGTVLDPFAGSGSTLIAAAICGFGYVGIEREAEYIEIAKRRLAADWQMELLG